jgi:hypothetical protein
VAEFSKSLQRKRRRQVDLLSIFYINQFENDGDHTPCMRLLYVIAALALLILIGSLIGLGFTVYWYWDELHQQRQKDLAVDKIKGK